ncbi:uncharacterized protein [Brachyistius frenatus]|uniref:uncharacterized protein isoform X1 n=2 Tax=Brachyistius frenatus TaxID=100188 RepID=UPI0037E98B20
MAPTEHLKMMRLLFLCLLLLLPTAAEDIEGSANDDLDDEDFVKKTVAREENIADSNLDKTTGVDETSNQLTLIVIVVAVTVLTLSVAAIVAIILVRRQMHNRQQGIYSVPAEQDQKGAV